MSFSVHVINAQLLQQLMQNLRKAEADLKEHVETDFEAVKTELEAIVAHFKSEIATIRTRFSATELDIIDKGQPPVQAVHQAANDAARAAQP